MKYLKQQFNYLWNRIRFWYFCNEADRMHKLTGKRYFIIPDGEKLKIVDNDYIKLYNKAASHLKCKKINIHNLLEACYYCTEMGTTGTRKKKSFNKSKRKTIFDKV